MKTGEATAAARHLRGLRSHLVGLVLVVLVPALALGAAATWAALRSYQTGIESRMVGTARAVARAVDSEMASALAALRILAASNDLQENADLARFDELARDTAKVFESWVVVYAPGPRPIVHTFVPFGAPLPNRGGAEGPGRGNSISEVFATGKAAVSNLGVGLAQRPVAFVFVPVVREGSVHFVAGMPLVPERLSNLLASQEDAGPGAVTITDGHGIVAARSRDSEALVGQASPRQTSNERLPNYGVVHGRRIEDHVPIRIAFSRTSLAPDWIVWVTEPESTFAEAWREPLLALAGGGILALCLGIGLAVALGRRLLRPVHDLVRRSHAVAAGGTSTASLPSVGAASVAEFEVLRHAGAQAEATLREGERQLREVLASLGEVVYALDADTRIRCTSRRALELWGMAEADVIGRRFLDILPQSTGSASWKLLEDAMAARIELRGCVLSPVFHRWIEIDAYPTEDGGLVVAVRDIEDRRHDQISRARSEAALRRHEARLEAALRGARLGTFERHLPSSSGRWDARAAEIFGGLSSDDCRPDLADWRERVHPEDRDRRIATIATAIGDNGSGTYDVEFRFRGQDGSWIWVATHGAVVERDLATGVAVRLAGVVQDVTERKGAEDHQRLMAREVDHRAKNVLAVVQAALRLTPREDAGAYAAAVEGRVRALARAHTLIASTKWNGADLRHVVEGELAPFLSPSAFGSASESLLPQATISGPPVRLDATTTQALSLVLHELATNATKYGALSRSGGLVTITWQITGFGQKLVLVWRETGGPAILALPVRRGFGSRVVETTVRGQLGGRVGQQWDAKGLICEIEIPLGRDLVVDKEVLLAVN